MKIDDEIKYKTLVTKVVFAFWTGTLDGSSPVLNLSKNTTDMVSDSEENGGDEDYSDNERSEENGKCPSGSFLSLSLSFTLFERNSFPQSFYPDHTHIHYHSYMVILCVVPSTCFS